ncbi:MAG: hypothetical protein WC209_01000 [Ignavibacteriaceae bacterium]|jgi:hypothetical protein
MAKVIDAEDLVLRKKKLPTEAFFVDTNIIILYKDPFSASLTNEELSRFSEKVSYSMEYLKANYKTYSTIYSAFEYYKHLQHHYFTSQTGDRFLNTSKFKKLKIENEVFKDGWKRHMISFRKVFYKNFPIINSNEDKANLIYQFESEAMDFGDYAIWKAVESSKETFHCIFSNDSDLYNISDDIYLLTTNPKIIIEAKSNGKLFI